MKRCLLGMYLFLGAAFAQSQGGALAPIKSALDTAKTDIDDINVKLIAFFGVIIVIAFAVYIFKEVRPK